MIRLPPCASAAAVRALACRCWCQVIAHVVSCAAQLLSCASTWPLQVTPLELPCIMNDSLDMPDSATPACTPQIMYNSRTMNKPRSQWRSREFGFVDFATPAEVQRAISTFHGAVLPTLTKAGSNLLVQPVKPPGPWGAY